MAVFGLRPPDLGGYDENAVAAGVRDKLTEILAAKKKMHPELWMLTGLLLGAEQLAAEAAREAGIPYVVVQPYPAPESQWPSSSRDRYADLIRHADAAVLLERTVPDSKQKFGAALGEARRLAGQARRRGDRGVGREGRGGREAGADAGRQARRRRLGRRPERLTRRPPVGRGG